MRRRPYRRDPTPTPPKQPQPQTPLKLKLARLYTALGTLFFFLLVCGECLFGDPVETLPGILYVGVLYLVGGLTFQAVLQREQQELPPKPHSRPRKRNRMR